MKLFRIAPSQYINDYSGRGGSFLDGGRWNRRNDPVLYFALNAATALLEMANYMPTPRRIPPSFRLGVYELPEHVMLQPLPDADLPGNWKEYPYPESTQAVGSAWLQAGEHLGLLVPSVAVPSGLDQICVINPLHPDIGAIELVAQVGDLYSPRAFKSL